MVARSVDAHVTKDEDPRRSGGIKCLVEPLILLAARQEIWRRCIAIDIDDYDIRIAGREGEVRLATGICDGILALAM